MRIRDDRGRPVALCRVDGLGPDVDAGVRAAADAANPLRMRRFAPGLLGVTALFLVMNLLRRVRGASRTPLVTEALFQAASLVTSAAVLLGLAWVYARWHGAKMVRRAYLAGSVCPSCGYSLAGLPAETDGCTVCPECSGAWRVGAGGNGVTPAS